MAQNTEQRDATVWASITEAATLLGVDPGTVRRRYNKTSYRFTYGKRERAGRTEYGIPQEELSELGIPADSTALEASMPGTAGPGTASTPGTAGHRPNTDASAPVYDPPDDTGVPVGAARRPAVPLDAWRDDLIAQIERLGGDKSHLREQLASSELAMSRSAGDHRAAFQKLEDEHHGVVTAMRTEHAASADAWRNNLDQRDELISGLREQVDALESKLREVLEQSQEQNHQLANRIADLVQQHADIHTRVLELEPVAAEVPMLQAAVEDTKAELTEREQILFQRERQLADINEDIETIASRPVAGPVFRLLTKGKLRI
jgi:hypothetical protein